MKLNLCLAAALTAGSALIAQAPPPVKTPATAKAVVVAPAPNAKAPAQGDGKYVTIKGQVKMSKYLKLKPENVITDKAICCKDGPLASTALVVDPKSYGVLNTAVWLRPDSTDRTAKIAEADIHPDLRKYTPKKNVIDQPKCQFEPRMLCVRAGDSLEIKNSSTIPHNINIQGGGMNFNVNIAAGSSYEPEAKFESNDRTTVFACNVHAWMQGRIRTFDHPYYAVTDKDGNFEIKNAPAGNYRIVYFHEYGFHKGREGVLGFPITIEAGKDGSTMELKPIELEVNVSEDLIDKDAK